MRLSRLLLTGLLTASTGIATAQPAAERSDETGLPFFSCFGMRDIGGGGTGLGLSLSYDIVVQSQGGALSVDSTEGGASFTISLPVKAVRGVAAS